MYSTKALYTANLRRGGHLRPPRRPCHPNDLLFSSSSTALRGALRRYPRLLAQLLRRSSPASLLTFLGISVALLLCFLLPSFHSSSRKYPLSPRTTPSPLGPSSKLTTAAVISTSPPPISHSVDAQASPSPDAIIKLLRSSRPRRYPPGTLLLDNTIFSPLSRSNTTTPLFLSDACFCPQRNRLLLAPTTHIPPALLRSGLAMTAPTWPGSHPAVHVTGTTLFWTGHGLQSPSAAALPALALLRAAHDLAGTQAAVAAALLRPRGPRAKEMAGWHALFLSNVPAARRLDLASARPALVCFDRVALLHGTHRASAGVFAAVKRPLGLPTHCGAQTADRKTVWILARASEKASAGDISNAEIVATVVNHVLLAQGLASGVRVRIAQGANVACARGSARAGCRAMDCGSGERECRRERSALEEVRAIGKMTVVVMAAGPEGARLTMLPKDAVVVEIFPYGVREGGNEEVLTTAGVQYIAVRNPAVRGFERALVDRFGDVARDVRTCWEDAECRAARVRRATRVDPSVVREAVGKALERWRGKCLLGAAGSSEGDNGDSDGDGEGVDGDLMR